MEFNNVSFCFPEDDEPVLENVSFNPREGTCCHYRTEREWEKDATLLMNRLYPDSCDGIHFRLITLFGKEHVSITYLGR